MKENKYTHTYTHAYILNPRIYYVGRIAALCTRHTDRFSMRLNRSVYMYLHTYEIAFLFVQNTIYESIIKWTCMWICPCITRCIYIHTYI